MVVRIENRCKKAYGDENGARVVSSAREGVVLFEARYLRFEGEDVKVFEDAEGRRSTWVCGGRRIPRGA